MCCSVSQKQSIFLRAFCDFLGFYTRRELPPHIYIKNIGILKKSNEVSPLKTEFLNLKTRAKIVNSYGELSHF